MKLIKKTVFAFSLFTCVAVSAETTSALVGIWAMHPLNNGIANVVDFKENNEVTLYSFTCSWVDGTYTTSPTEESEYVEDRESKVITVTNPQRSFDLAVLELGEQTMQLLYVEHDLSMTYYKVEEIEPLCDMQALNLLGV